MNQFEYKGRTVNVYRKGYSRYLSIDGEEFSIGLFEIPEEAARKIIDSDEEAK
jgi:hypothetical protein